MNGLESSTLNTESVPMDALLRHHYDDVLEILKDTPEAMKVATEWKALENYKTKWLPQEQEAALSTGLDLSDPFIFEDFLDRWVEREGFRFIFLLDEFGVIARSQKFDLDFFDNLRSTIPTLNYILGTPHSLADYAHEQVVTSPLWNKLQLIQLTLFERRESIHKLIRNPIEQFGLSWPNKAEEFIYERGGQFPCYIQMAASALFDSQEDWRMDYRRAEKVFRDTATQHFRHLWTNSLYDQYRPGREEMLRGALLDLVHRRTIDDDLAEDLESRSLVWRNEVTGMWEPFSAWFADWLRRWSTDSRAKVETESSNLREKTNEEPVTPLPKPSRFKKGHILDGVYRVEETLSVTKNSYLIKAFDERLHRTVALKFPRLEHETQDEIQRLRENLLREARILASFDHNNIGSIYQVILDPLGIVMAWIEGTPLEKALEERMLPNDVVEIGVDLAEALNYVHEQDKVHRDIKPSNIIQHDIRGAVLIDFGIARATMLDTITRLDDGSSGYVGTTDYSAPEQFLKPEGVGPPTDLFALGVVLYQLLTGKFPYYAGNLPSLYGGCFPPVEPFDIPASLYEILCSLLQQEPNRRPTAAELHEQLEICLRQLNAGHI